MNANRSGLFRVTSVAIVCSLIFVAVEAWAQSGGVRGKVVNQNGEPVEGAEVQIEYTDGLARSYTATSDEKGEFMRLGLGPGNYRLLFRKERHEPAIEEIRVRLGSPYDIGQVVLFKVPDEQLTRQEAEDLTAEVQKILERGVADVEKEDYPAALDAFLEVIEKVPGSADAHFNVGFVYKKMKAMDDALTHFQKATELQPGYYEAWVEMGDIYNNSGKYPEAIQAFEKSIAIRSEVSPLYNYGAACLNAGEIPKAQEAFEKALALDPNHAGANYQMGMVLVNQGKNDEAVTYLEKYLELEPEGPNAATAKGILDYLKQGT